jgi:hypothetical protein
MASNDDRTDTTSDSAPDLKILGDEITLQPSGYVEPAVVEGKEEALMSQFASFRAEPLKYVHATEPSRTLPKADTTCAGSFAKSPYTSPARDGAPTTKSSANPSSTPASLSA